jgi:hypothetical protein
VRAHLALYARSPRAGRRRTRAPCPERERIWQATEDAWGRELPRRSAEELGFA